MKQALLTKNTGISRKDIPANRAEPGPSPRFLKKAWPKSLENNDVRAGQNTVKRIDVRKYRGNGRSEKIVARQYRSSMVGICHGDIH